MRRESLCPKGRAAGSHPPPSCTCVCYLSRGPAACMGMGSVALWEMAGFRMSLSLCHSAQWPPCRPICPGIYLRFKDCQKSEWSGRHHQGIS